MFDVRGTKTMFDVRGTKTMGNLPLLVLLVQQCEAEHPTDFVLMSCTWLTFDDKSNGIHHCIVYSVCFFSNRCLEKPVIECDLLCDSAENHLHKRLKCGFKQVTSMPPTNLNSYLMILNRKKVTDITWYVTRPRPISINDFHFLFLCWILCASLVT